ncbi:MAG: PHP domain-containing protein [Desulfobacteraceae bacterium]|nr:PHP domain-containing protein [Desulfobacteraceae bacterium]
MGYKSGNIDLHIHSSASDGSLSPEQILGHAIECGLAAIAITDHDAVEGAAAVLRRGIPENLDFITGVEISAGFPSEFDIPGSMHILGYGFSIDDPNLNLLLTQQQQARSSRNPKIIEKLNGLGIRVTLEQIEAETGRQEIARPHIAAHLVRKGFAANIEEAFDRYLARGRPAYVDKFRIPAEKAVSAIGSSGGISVLAHPGLLPDSLQTRPEKFISIMVGMGLGGIEAYYPGHSPEQTAEFEKIAEKHGLLITGGTDFHGDINPQISIGKGLGNMAVPYEVFRRLTKALAYKKT